MFNTAIIADSAAGASPKRTSPPMKKAQRSVTSVLFLSAHLPQLELPGFLCLPLLTGAGEAGLFPLLLLELQGLLGGGRCSVPGWGGLNRSVRQCSRR